MTTHTERIRASLRGELIDRPPVALWRHFPVDDQAPETLAAAALHFQHDYDFDLVKVTPASSFAVRDWGVEDEWRGDTEGTRQYTKRVVREPGDWERLPGLEPSAPALAAQIEALRLIRRELGPETPMLQTVFSPLAQAKNLASNQTLLEHIHSHPEAVMRGLVTIAETTRRFIEACLATGIDGVFYAIQHAQSHLLSAEEYTTFGLTHDQRALEPAGELWCNVLHLHGHNVNFALANALPFQIVNWHDRETPPSLHQALDAFPGVLCGGLRQDTLVFGTATDVQDEAWNVMAYTSGRRFILSTGCVVPVIAPHGNLLAARRIVESKTA